MAAEVARAFVTLLPSFQGGSAAISKELGGPAGQAADEVGKSTGKRLGSGMFSAAKTFIAPLAAAFVGAGAVTFLSDAITEARDAAKVGRLTAAVIKSTGAAAGVSATQVADLAEALSNKAGVDDEAIQSGANLLLTFTKVRNEAGKGNDIFNRATAAALDMSAAMGVDMKAASLQVGKALNDPVKGVNALSRAGVSFTAAQKEQIKKMVESGNVMGAQKLILSELTTQFGGAAAAAADPAEKAKVAWGNFKEEIGTALLPILNNVMSFLTGTALPAAKQLIAGLQGKGGEDSGFAKFGRAVRAVVLFIKDDAIPTIQSFAAWIQRNRTPILVIAGLITAVFLPGLIAMGVTALVSGAKTLAGWVMTQAGAIAAAAIHSVSVIRMIAGWVLLGVQSLIQAAKVAAAWLIAMGPVGIIIAIVIGLVALIILNWDRIKKWTVAAFSFVVNWIKNNWKLLISIILGPLGIIIALVVTHWAKIKKAFFAALKFVVNLVKTYINLVIAYFRFIGRIYAIVRAAFARVVSAARTYIGNLIATVRGIPGRIRSALGNLGRLLYESGRRIIQGLINGIKNMVGRVKNAVSGVLKSARNLLPFSPAKEGPFSGRGWTLYSGMSIGESLAEGMDKSQSLVRQATNDLATAARPNLGNSTVTGKPSQVVINGQGMDRHLLEWLKGAVRTTGGGKVQVALGWNG